MGRGNPAFLLGYLPNCFLDILSGLLRITFRWYRPHGMGLAMTGYKMASLRTCLFRVMKWRAEDVVPKEFALTGC